MNDLTLYHAHDPMCSFCWAFRPTWEAILPELKKTLTTINVVGGLAPDSDQPMPADMQTKLSSTWKHIEESIPGTQFNHAFWTDCKPRRSTYPACRSALIARNNGGAELEDKITLAIQQAYYLNAQNPSDEDTLVNAAITVGLSPNEFTQDLRSDQINQQLKEELRLARSLHLNSFPGIMVANDNEQVHIPIEYNDSEEMLRRIQKNITQLS